jgi:hypothetical protein
MRSILSVRPRGNDGISDLTPIMAGDGDNACCRWPCQSGLSPVAGVLDRIGRSVKHVIEVAPTPGERGIGPGDARPASDTTSPR